MVITGREARLGTSPLQSPRLGLDIWRAWAHRRLTTVFEAARQVPFDDDSKIVFFSDCHRGDKGKTDAFARNEVLYHSVLDHYYEQGFTYIEVGDGDELWKNGRFSDILRAHGRTFDRLHRFNDRGRLHIVFGNHDIRGPRHSRVSKDGIPAEEGLILTHAKTGQRLFVVHGHQADFTSDGLYAVSRLAVRHVWRRLQLLSMETALRRLQGVVLKLVTPGASRIIEKIERRIIEWIQVNRQLVICGHTHRPMSSVYGAPPYFNTGSCVVPGVITGLEIQKGDIALVKWSGPAGEGADQKPAVRRELLAPPKTLDLFAG